MSGSLQQIDVNLQLASGPRLDVRDISLVERISGLFEFTLRVVSDDPSIDFEPIIGKEATVQIRSDAPSQERTWKGVATHAEQERAVQSGAAGELSTYVFRVAPSLWHATLRKNYRIFQHLSIPDIVDQVIAPYGANAAWRVERASYPKLWQKVQYGESDFNFMSRLLEEAGIDYAFVDGSLLFGDHLSDAAFADHGSLSYQQTLDLRTTEVRFARNARVISVPRPTDHVSIDADLRRPAYDLQAGASASGIPRLEQVDYTPGGFLRERQGEEGGTPAADDKATARHDQDLGTFKNQRFLEGDQRTGRNVAKFRFEHPRSRSRDERDDRSPSECRVRVEAPRHRDALFDDDLARDHRRARRALHERTVPRRAPHLEAQRQRRRERDGRRPLGAGDPHRRVRSGADPLSLGSRRLPRRQRNLLGARLGGVERRWLWAHRAATRPDKKCWSRSIGGDPDSPVVVGGASTTEAPTPFPIVCPRTERSVPGAR